MTEIRRIRIRRERASLPAVALAFLAFSIVFFLATLSVKQEKSILDPAPSVHSETREIAFPDAGIYLVSLNGGQSMENARLTSARFMQRGAAGYLYEMDGKWFSVGNMYFSKDEAEKIASHLAENHLSASVIPLKQTGVTLRVTAEASALDALSFIISAFSDFETSLLDYSERIDAGVLSEREARVLLSVLSFDVSEKKPEAEKAVLASGDNAAKEIFNMYLNLLETASSLTKNAGGEMMLSARIKFAAIDCAIARMNLLKKLNA